MNIFTADIGQGKAHFYDSGANKFYGKRNDIDLIDINIPGINSGDFLVVEDAHLRESHKNTLAQPFSFEQLKRLENNARKKGIELLAFPQKSTPKARKLAGYDSDSKTDEADTKAIAQFLTNDQEAFRCLKTFVPTRLEDYQKQNQHNFEYIQQANEDINPAKSSEYGFGNIDYEDEVSKWIKKYSLRICEYLGCDEELMEVIGLSFDKKGKSVIVSVNDHQIKVNSFDETIASLMVYDLRGRLLYENGSVNTSEFIIQNLKSTKYY